MDKYEYIVNLAEKTAKRVSQNRESWMKFLTSAARIYKYPFKEQLLIYAQNPDATACASIEIWNKRMYCIGSNKYMAVQTAQNPLKKELLKFQISSRRMPIQNFKLIIRIYRIG